MIRRMGYAFLRRFFVLEVLLLVFFGGVRDAVAPVVTLAWLAGLDSRGLTAALIPVPCRIAVILAM